MNGRLRGRDDCTMMGWDAEKEDAKEGEEGGEKKRAGIRLDSASDWKA